MKNKWLDHIAKIRKENPKKNLADILKLAKRSYKK